MASEESVIYVVQVPYKAELVSVLDYNEHAYITEDLAPLVVLEVGYCAKKDLLERFGEIKKLWDPEGARNDLIALPSTASQTDKDHPYVIGTINHGAHDDNVENVFRYVLTLIGTPVRLVTQALAGGSILSRYHHTNVAYGLIVVSSAELKLIQDFFSSPKKSAGLADLVRHYSAYCRRLIPDVTISFVNHQVGPAFEAVHSLPMLFPVAEMRAEWFREALRHMPDMDAKQWNDTIRNPFETFLFKDEVTNEIIYRDDPRSILYRDKYCDGASSFSAQ